MEEKKELRKKILALRDGLTEEQRIKMSRAICERFINLQISKETPSLMIFLNFGSEVITDFLAFWAWEQGKKVFVPRCLPATRELKIYPIYSFNDVEKGHFGIREPKENLYEPANLREINLVVVPAVAFDRKGFRIGYGGGYYDRFLPKIHAVKIGLAFSCQIISEVPKNPFDVAVDGIVTEEEYIETKSNNP